jgi:hypothetical protein
MLESSKNFPANYLFCIFFVSKYMFLDDLSLSRTMLSKEKGNLKALSPYIVQGVRRRKDAHLGEVKR